MDYWENREECERRGIDSDLSSCLEYNPQNGFELKDVNRVLAVFEGEHDTEHWRWILQLKDNTFVFMQGWCDYTGWDCQSSAISQVCPTIAECFVFARTNPFDYTPNTPEIIARLAKQVLSGKQDTSHQVIGKDLGLL
jgi:hypothetical protein